MAFNKNAFAASFLNQLTAGIEEREEKAEEFERQQKAAAERNASIVSQRKLRADEAVALAQKAKALGARKEHIVAAMSSGMTGISQLYQKLLDGANQLGVKKLGEADVETIVNMPVVPPINGDFVDFSLRDLADKTFGVAKLEKAQQEDDKQSSLVRRLFGLDDMAMAEKRLQDTEYVEGMSIADINEAARQAEYESQFKDLGFTLLDVNFYGPKGKSQFISKFNDAATDAVTGTVAEDYINGEVIREDRERKEEQQPPLTEDEEQAIRKRARNELIRLAVEPVISEFESEYGRGGFYRDTTTKEMIESVLGEDYVIQQASIFGDDREEQEEEETKEEITPFIASPTDEDMVTEELLDSSKKEEEAPEEKAPDPEDQKTALSKITFRKRPNAIDAGRKLWDRNLEGKVDPKTGKVIIAPPRPAEGGGKTKTVIRRNQFGIRTGTKKVTEAEYWDATYGSTHNKNTGLPLNIDKLLNADPRLLEK
tara:strand:+ start:465 stop:1916 length:1452 start_codon:yes stop_codon:yes gene_type:complete